MNTGQSLLTKLTSKLVNAKLFTVTIYSLSYECHTKQFAVNYNMHAMNDQVGVRFAQACLPWNMDIGVKLITFLLGVKIQNPPGYRAK